MGRATPKFVLLSLLLALLSPAGILAQSARPDAAGCDAYAACALRVQHRLFKTNVVRGSGDEVVAQIGFRTPPLENLFARSPEAALDFALFREDHRRSAWLGFLGGVGFLGGLIAGAKGEEGWAAGLSLGGTVFSMGSGLFRTKANEHMSSAIWWHNGSLELARRPGG